MFSLLLHRMSLTQKFYTRISVKTSVRWKACIIRINICTYIMVQFLFFLYVQNHQAFTIHFLYANRFDKVTSVWYYIIVEYGVFIQNYNTRHFCTQTTTTCRTVMVPIMRLFLQHFTEHSSCWKNKRTKSTKMTMKILKPIEIKTVFYFIYLIIKYIFRKNNQ